MAKNKELRNSIKEQLITAIESVLSKVNNDAAIKFKKKIKKASEELSKTFSKEIVSIEKKKAKNAAKAEAKTKTTPKERVKKPAAGSPKKPVVPTIKNKTVAGKRVKVAKK